MNVVWHTPAITKLDRNRLNGHKSFVLWFTGLSGSGKSTLAHAIDKEFFHMGYRSYVLDGDNIRHGLNQDLGFQPEDRKENIRRLGEVAKLFVDSGQIILAAMISPYQDDRESVRNRFKENEFVEVYVHCPLHICESRDPKGLYKKARLGKISEFTGITSPYEPPAKPEITIDTSVLSLDQSVQTVLHYLERNGMI